MRIKLSILLVLCVVLTQCSKKITENETENYSSFVNPFIGTAGHGHTFPGATMPFGMVQLSPDTGTEGWDWCSGYHASDSSIIGFSHTHLSGTGRSEALDILVMPTVGALKTEAGTKENPDSGYRSRFTHANEKASPGFYSVRLDDYDVQVSLTASKRAGLHQYIFPKTEQAHIILDLFHSYKTDIISGGEVTIVNDSLIIGSRKSRGWGEPGEEYFVDHEVFFAARFSKPFRHAGIVVDGEMMDNVKTGKGKSVKAYVDYATNKDEPIYVKVAISAVDADNALKNLDEEIKGWDFEAVHQNAVKEWNKVLSAITVEAPTPAKKEIFYTAMYHACIAPYLYNDVDGRYRGFDGKVHEAKGFENYTGLSLWDTFRAANPLYTLIQPARVPDMINSMLAQYDQYKLLPVWPLYNSETNCMIGYHAVPVIVDAWQKGIKGFDEEKAYEAMKTSAMQDKFGIKFLKEYNYIPTDLENKSVSKTLEYAFDDWCIAQYAKALGKTGDYDYFMKRSQAYKNVYEPKSGFMRGKKADGTFNKEFDPTFSSYGNSDFIEGNSWQYSWFVPHDVPGLINLMGGKEAFLKKLDALFAVETSSHESKPVDITGLIGEYAHGNEPSHHVAYLYTLAGKPEKTAEKVKYIMQNLYTDQRDGLCGNEDMGQMSAWYVFSAMGFYPVNPASGNYVIGTPLLQKATIHLENGKSFTITAKDLSDSNMYIQSASLNGKEYDKLFLQHKDILAGGGLTLQMGSQPSKKWGLAKTDPSEGIKE